MTNSLLYKATRTIVSLLFITTFVLSVCDNRKRFIHISGYGMLPLTGNWMSLSRAECARECFSSYKKCSSFQFDNSLSQCMLGSWVHKKLSQQNGSLSVYAMEQSICNSDYLDLELKSYGTITACVTPTPVGVANWFEASAKCKENGLRLYYSENMNKMTLANMLMEPYSEYLIHQGLKAMWIDVNDLTTEGVYLHENGEIPVALFWGKTQPGDSNNNEDCIEMVKEPEDIVFNDMNCNTLRSYLCEMPPL